MLMKKTQEPSRGSGGGQNWLQLRDRAQEWLQIRCLLMMSE